MELLNLSLIRCLEMFIQWGKEERCRWLLFSLAFIILCLKSYFSLIKPGVFSSWDKGICGLLFKESVEGSRKIQHQWLSRKWAPISHVEKD